MCKQIQQRDAEATTEEMDEIVLLRKFKGKHRPMIFECTVQALDLYNDPTRSQRYILIIDLERRPHSNQPAIAFRMVDARVVAFEDMESAQRNEMRIQMHQAEGALMGSGDGTIGVMFTMLRVNTGAATIAGAGFTKDVLVPSRDWKGLLRTCMNNGVVV